MKIAIFGADGQLGRDVASALSGHTVEGVDIERVDIRREDDVRRLVESITPEYAVNCAAMTHVEDCERDPLAAFETNALGARNIARACAEQGASMLQVSTDYVFDGSAQAAYTEADTPRPINAYGISKLAGEHFTLYECANTLVVRTSGLYGVNICRGKGGNFVETMLARAAAGTPLSVVQDERLTPTFTFDLAQQMRVIIEAGAPAGIYHATNGGGCSWYEFTVELMRLAGVEVDVKPIRAADWKSPVRRPANSVLENRALQALGLDRMPGWRDALSRYMAVRAPAA